MQSDFMGEIILQTKHKVYILQIKYAPLKISNNFCCSGNPSIVFIFGINCQI